MKTKYRDILGMILLAIGAYILTLALRIGGDFTFEELDKFITRLKNE